MDATPTARTCATRIDAKTAGGSMTDCPHQGLKRIRRQSSMESTPPKIGTKGIPLVMSMPTSGLACRTELRCHARLRACTCKCDSNLARVTSREIRVVIHPETAQLVTTTSLPHWPSEGGKNQLCCMTSVAVHT
eukprot:scaffold23187_cov32-Tisochrysis_lutea.AAC.2